MMGWLNEAHFTVDEHRTLTSAESTLGQGTTFRVTVPLGATHLPPDLVVEERPSPATQRCLVIRADGYGPCCLQPELRLSACRSRPGTR